MLLQLLGIVGALLVLGAYLALQRGWLTLERRVYHVMNLVGAFLSTEVAKTVSGGIIREGNDGIQITPEIIFAGLMGATASGCCS